MRPRFRGPLRFLAQRPFHLWLRCAAFTRLRSFAMGWLLAWRRPFPLLHLPRGGLRPRFLLALHAVPQLILQIA
jgi:hypothetical protein